MRFYLVLESVRCFKGRNKEGRKEGRSELKETRDLKGRVFKRDEINEVLIVVLIFDRRR